jgi:hypothetical protein
MSRLIDADAFIRYIDRGRLRSQHELCFSERDVVKMIDKQPTIEAEPVKHGRWDGRWVKVADLCGIDVLKCSVCGKEHPRLPTAYCPDCGAKMDGGNEGEDD